MIANETTVGSGDLVATAIAVVTDMERRLAEARATAEQISDARRPLAFGAAKGDAGAAKRLAELTSEASATAQQIADLEVALQEARGQVSSAEASAVTAVDGAALERARELAGLLIYQSARIDQAFSDIVAAVCERQRLHREIFEDQVHPHFPREFVG